MGGFRLAKKNADGSIEDHSDHSEDRRQREPESQEEESAEGEKAPPQQGITMATDGTGKRRDSVKVSISLSRSLHTRLKLEAVRRGESIVSMMSRWVAETMPAA